MSSKIDMTTIMVWRDPDSTNKRKLTVWVSPFDEVNIRYEVSGVEDQVLYIDEPAWHALYSMLGEVSK